MGNMPLQYVLKERRSAFGRLKGKTVIQAMPTGRKRISHRNAEIAKKQVENGNIVEFGDIGTLTPSFKSKQIEKGVEEFNAKREFGLRDNCFRC